MADADVQRVMLRWLRRSEPLLWIHGLLGKPDGTIAVAGRTGEYWVRVSVEGTQSLTTAKSIGGVPARAGTPVRMKLENNAYVIYHQDPSIAPVVTVDDVPNDSGVLIHNHWRGTGLEYEVEALQLEQGRVRFVSGLNVYVNAFRYFYNGDWETWEGGNLNLASYRPSTSGHWAWVLVGINPATNTAVAVAGTSQIYATALTIDQIDSISFSNYIPLTAIKLRNDQTNLADLTIYQDAHEWFGHGVGFSDAEGDPADVGTTADGTSEFAARRDHVHAIDIGMDDLNDAVIVGTPDDYDVLHWNSGGYWGPSDMAFLLKQNTGALYGDFVGWRPLNVAAVPFGGSVGTYPTFWTEATAATYATMAVPNTMWTLQGDTTNNVWRYHGDGDFNIESGVTSDGWLSYWFGPILLKDGLYPTDVEYRLGVYAPDGVDTDADIFARIAIQWDASAELWQVRSEQKDGTTQTDGSWVPLARTPITPFVVRVAIRNNATKTARVYIGGGGLHLLHTLLGESDLNSTMGVAKIQFSMARTSGGTEPDDVISIAGIDYSLNP